MNGENSVEGSEVCDTEEEAPDEDAAVPEDQAAVVEALDVNQDNYVELRDECDPDSPEYNVDLQVCKVGPESVDGEGEGSEEAEEEEETSEEEDDDDDEPGVIDEIRAIYNAKKKDGILSASWAAGSVGLMEILSKLGDAFKRIVNVILGKKDKDKDDESDEVADASGAGVKVIAVIDASIEAGETNFDNCWDWVNKKFKEAGFKLGECPRVYAHPKFKDQSKANDLVDSNFDKSVLKPGCHVIYHNNNKTDKWTTGSLKGKVKGDHSGVFVKWIDKNNMIAEMASFGGPGKGPPRKQNIDFKRWPVQAVRDPRLANA